MASSAALAHLVEQLICNHQVVSSIPTRGTIYQKLKLRFKKIRRAIEAAFETFKLSISIVGIFLHF